MIRTFRWPKGSKQWPDPNPPPPLKPPGKGGIG